MCGWAVAWAYSASTGVSTTLQGSRDSGVGGRAKMECLGDEVAVYERMRSLAEKFKEGERATVDST